MKNLKIIDKKLFFSKWVSNVILIIIVLLMIYVYSGHNKCNRQVTVVERDTVTVTVVRRDTVWRETVKYYTVEKPIPVMIYDTVQVMGEYGVKLYHDTLMHEYGNIYRWEWVKGDLLKKDLKQELNFPTITETITTTQTVTNTVRNNLIYLTGGFRTNNLDNKFNTVPTIGAIGVFKNQNIVLGVNYGLDKQLNVDVGIAIFK